MSKSSIKVGDKFPTNEGGVAEVVDYVNSREVYVKFDDFEETRYVHRVESGHLRKGECKNPYHKRICSVGYLGVGKYKCWVNDKNTKEYNLWVNMLKRCYDPKSKDASRYLGRGVTVCDEWHNFQVFAEWCNQQPHFGEEGFHLDKDLMVKDSKSYSPKTCSFIPNKVNSLLVNRYELRGELPIGVSKARGKYTARCNNGSGKLKHLGHYSTPEESFQAYKTYKENLIKEVAEEEYLLGNINLAVYNILMNWEIVPYPQ